MVSELVTNADRHSNGPYILELEGTDSAVHIRVYDSSAALPRRFPKDPERVGRHGLEIVHALAERVTVERVPVGKRVCAVVALNRAVAVSMVHGPEAALREVETLERDGRLDGYRYLPATKADLLHRLGRDAEAAEAYREALALPGNAAEEEFLTERIRATTP